MEQKDLETLEARIRYTADIIEIEQLQNRYQQYLAISKGDKIIELFSQKAADVSLEIGNSGVYEGAEGIRRFFGFVKESSNVIKGILAEHQAVCPVIEIAKDGKTAKGTWFSPGIVSMPPMNIQMWSWGKYSCDYLREDGKWKIWHIHYYLTFETPYDKGWLHEQEVGAMGNGEGDGIPIKPDKPTTYHRPYDPSDVNCFLPEPPEPYDTWDG